MGEQLLSRGGDANTLGLLLCARTESEHIARDARAARATLERALALAKDLDAGVESELGRALARVSKLIEG